MTVFDKHATSLSYLCTSGIKFICMEINKSQVNNIVHYSLYIFSVIYFINFFTFINKLQERDFQYQIGLISELLIQINITLRLSKGYFTNFKNFLRVVSFLLIRILTVVCHCAKSRENVNLASKRAIRMTKLLAVYFLISFLCVYVQANAVRVLNRRCITLLL